MASNVIDGLLIYCNTAARDLTDTYARLLRAHSARGRVRIYQSNPEHVRVTTFMEHFQSYRARCGARDDIVSKLLIVKKGGAISEKAH